MKDTRLPINRFTWRFALPTRKDLINWAIAALLFILLLTGCSGPATTPATVTLPTAQAKVTSQATATPPPPPLPTTTEATTLPALPVQSEEGQRRWREDLHHLVERAQRMHPDFTYRVSPEQFALLVEHIDAAIPFLNDDQIVAELVRLMAQSDGHTRLQPHGEQAGFRLYDLQLYQFGEELYVVDAASSLQEAVGARLVGIGPYDIEQLWELLSPLVAHENEMFVRLVWPLFLVTPEVLQAYYGVENASQPGFVLEDAGGTRFTVNPPILELPDTLNLAETFGRLLLPQQPEPLYLSQHQDEHFWYTLLEDEETLYVQYNRVLFRTGSGQSIDGFVVALQEQLQSNRVARVVLDLRHNMGGELGYQDPLLEWLQAYSAGNPGTLFVLIGRQTFSAGSYLTSQLEQTTDAVFVGEPTGSRPNFYANSRPVLLPNSLITAHVSTRYYEPSAADDERAWIAPDISAPPSAAAYFAGRDPALEAIR